MNSNISPSDPLISLAIELKSQCNRYTNGVCQTAICLKRGGHKLGYDPDYDIATCPRHEQVKALEKLLSNH